jgi:hypothetical protein
MTEDEAFEFSKTNNTKIIRNDCESVRNSPIKRIKDGFKSGYDQVLGTYVKGKRHYNQILKDRGLVEVGNEKISQTTKRKTNFIDESTIRRAINQERAEISDREADAMIKGEYKAPIIEKVESGGFAEINQA